MSLFTPPPPSLALNVREHFGEQDLPKLDEHHAKQRLIISNVDGLEFVGFDEILVVQANGSYSCVLCVSGKKHILSRNLHTVESMLPKSIFHRCHRSSVINLSKVAKLLWHGGYRAILIGGLVVEISRRHWPELLDAIGNI